MYTAYVKEEIIFFLVESTIDYDVGKLNPVVSGI